MQHAGDAGDPAADRQQHGHAGHELRNDVRTLHVEALRRQHQIGFGGAEHCGCVGIESCRALTTRSRSSHTSRDRDEPDTSSALCANARHAASYNNSEDGDQHPPRHVAESVGRARATRTAGRPSDDGDRESRGRAGDRAGRCEHTAAAARRPPTPPQQRQAKPRRPRGCAREPTRRSDRTCDPSSDLDVVDVVSKSSGSSVASGSSTVMALPRRNAVVDDDRSRAKTPADIHVTATSRVAVPGLHRASSETRCMPSSNTTQGASCGVASSNITLARSTRCGASSLLASTVAPFGTTSTAARWPGRSWSCAMTRTPLW